MNSKPSRVYNFGAGPAMLPEPVLVKAQEALLDWDNSGLSILEIGHRTDAFISLLNHAEQTLRQLLGIPNNYHVLFLGGAARTHFSMIPLNFLKANQTAAYLVSGVWSHMALQEAQRLKKAYCLASTEAQHYATIPFKNEWAMQEAPAYLYYTPNETINGTRFPYVPKIEGVPLIADMTSCLLSEPIDIRHYDLIFAGAQKNIANAGLTLVIIKDEFINAIDDSSIPTMLNYKIQARHHSIYATPPVFNCYVAAQMFNWLNERGGIDAFYTQNCRKAAALYQYIDSTDFYSSSVDPQVRSIMNVCFSLTNCALEEEFVQQAHRQGLEALQGHRFVGGLRASIYNAMPIDGVMALIEFMRDFAQGHGS